MPRRVRRPRRHPAMLSRAPGRVHRHVTPPGAHLVHAPLSRPPSPVSSPPPGGTGTNIYNTITPTTAIYDIAGRLERAARYQVTQSDRTMRLIISKHVVV